MTGAVARLPTHGLALAVGAVLVVFIVVPLGAVLIESFHVAGSLSDAEMRGVVLDALDRLDPGERGDLLRRWAEQLEPTQRMEAVAATLQALGRPVPWDRAGPFDEQIPAAERAVAALPPAERAAFDAELPLQVARVHKRIALAFRVRPKLTPAEFDVLRSGAREGYGLRHYVAFVRERRLLVAAWHSLFVSTTAALITVTLAYAVAFGINRRGIRAPQLVRFAVLTPLVSPPIIMAFAGILLLGRRGLVTKSFLQDRLGVIDADETNLYGVTGVIVAMVLHYLPHAFIILDDVLARHDGRVEEAAAGQGATAWEVFRHVTLPLTRPGVIRAALVVFILSMTDFANPQVIGRGYLVLAGVLYDEIIGFQNTGLAAALCVWLMIPTFVAYLLFERIGRRRRFATTAAGGPPELPLPRAARAGLTTVAVGLSAVIAAFYLTVVWGSFTRVWGVDFSPTLDHYRLESELNPGVSRSRGIPLIWASFRVAGLAALAGGVLSILVAYLVERVRPVGARAIAFIALLPAIVPGVIKGVGYLVAFNAPLGFKELSLTGTGAILVLNILFANIFVGVLAGRAVLQRLDPAVDEAAEILGANLAQRFCLVTVPMMKHVLLLATLYVFVHGMVTLSAVLFLVSPDHDLASVGIFQNVEGGRYGIACAMSVVMLVIVFGVMALIWLVERRSSPWTHSLSLPAGGRGLG